MASSNEESASNKRKIDEEGDDPCKEKEAKVADPLTDTVLAVNTKVNDTWMRINKALTEAKVRPCTKYESGEMSWKYGVYDVVLSVLAFYDHEAKGVVASYRIAYYEPSVKYEHFTEAQQDEMIAFLKQKIERAGGYAVRDAVTSYVDKEASHWRELMHLIAKSHKIPFSSTWRADGNYISLKWMLDGKCVSLDRCPDDEDGACFRVARSMKWDDAQIPCVYFQKPEEAVAQVEKWLASL